MQQTTVPINHVILADDDRDHAFLFAHVLKEVDAGKTLTVARDGYELLALLTTTTPDLLFLDLNMPLKNGMECLQEIRNNTHLANLPIIVYSSSTRMSDIQKAYIHKADLYMVKPFHAEHLKHALQSVLTIDLKKEQALKNHYFINNRFVPFTATINFHNP